MVKQIILPQITEKEFFRRLRERPFEDIGAIRTIESFFKKKRGYIFKMHKTVTPFMLLVAVGLDSTTTWWLLLLKYKLVVYPLFIFRDSVRSKKEEHAADYFWNYFYRKYPNQVMPLMKFHTILSPPEITLSMEKEHYYHPKRVLDLIGNEMMLKYPNFYPQRVLPYIHVFYAMVYAQYLYEHFDVKIRTVLTAVLAGDGLVVPSQTLTSLRTALLSVCHTTADYSWQFASITFEKELGHWFYKKDVILLGNKMGLPLEKTWSCYSAGLFQCGNRCQTCKNRRDDFRGSGLIDKTVYLEDLTWVKWMRHLGLMK